MLHNPFGTLKGEAMQFDQYLHAEAAGLDWLTDDFVKAWRPLTRGDDGPKIEVIAYLGRFQKDPEFQSLRKAGDTHGWMQRAWRSVRAPLAAGMSVAIDSASVTPKNSPAYRFAALLRTIGVRVYIEPRPDANKPHWHDYPIISTDHHWHRANPANFKGAKHKARNEQLTGEILRIVRNVEGPPPLRNVWLRKLASVVDDGDTIVLPLHRLLNTRNTLTGLLERGRWLQQQQRSPRGSKAPE
jgi:hypothetical protein